MHNYPDTTATLSMNYLLWASYHQDCAVVSACAVELIALTFSWGKKIKIPG